MGTYTEEELIDALAERLRDDDDLRRDVAAAVVHKRRSWLQNLVVGVVQFLFGKVISSLVDSAIDWLVDRFS